MREFPADIITELLYRSPVKSLLRFRCLSKSLSSLIDSPLFIKSHLNRSLNNKTKLTLIILEYLCTYYPQTALYSLDFHSIHTPLLALENKFRLESILGSCNGLLLFKVGLNVDGHYQLALYNPSTREYRNLPPSPIDYVNGDYITKAYCGLTYDSFHHDYRIIKFVKTSPYADCKLKLWVYSLQYNLWKSITDDFPYYFYDPFGVKNGWKADRNGTLHMVVDKSYCDQTKLIVAVDVPDENVYIVPMPTFFNEEQHKKKSVTVDVLDGSLSLVVVYEGHIDVWVMNVYGVVESWMKLFSLLGDGRYYCFNLGLMGYSKKRNEVLLDYHGINLVWFNLKTNEIKDVDVGRLLGTFTSEVYVSSLVPLNGHGKVMTGKEA